jgi:hypothetical protein
VNIIKMISSLIKILILASALYLIQNKLVAQDISTVLPSGCVSSPESLILTQPNGMSITVIGKGNLNNHWTETVDGYTIVRNAAGNYEYANTQNGNLVPSGIIASNPFIRSSLELKFISTVTKSLKPRLNLLKNSILNQVNAHLQNKTFPTSGNIRVLALLIDYPDLLTLRSKLSCRRWKL